MVLIMPLGDRLRNSRSTTLPWRSPTPELVAGVANSLPRFGELFPDSGSSRADCRGNSLGRFEIERCVRFSVFGSPLLTFLSKAALDHRWAWRCLIPIGWQAMPSPESDQPVVAAGPLSRRHHCFGLHSCMLKASMYMSRKRLSPCTMLGPSSAWVPPPSEDNAASW